MVASGKYNGNVAACNGCRQLIDRYTFFDSSAMIGNVTVQNQKINDNMKFIEADLNNKIAAEKNARCCADNSIVTYANATFYAKLVADVTAGTETTAQATYNPIPNCGCGCGR